MDKYIYRMEVSELNYPKQMNWLGEWDAEYNEDDFQGKRYELYFPTFEKMSEKLKEITEGCHQYWANVYKDLYDNNIEELEYHNGKGAWDKEIHIETSRIYLRSDLLNSIKEIEK